jgi:hypothetical protein
VVLDEKIPTLGILQGVPLAGWPRAAAREFTKTGTAVMWKCPNGGHFFSQEMDSGDFGRLNVSAGISLKVLVDNPILSP